MVTPTPYDVIKYLGTLELMAVCFVLYIGLISTGTIPVYTLGWVVFWHTVHRVYIYVPKHLIAIVLLAWVSNLVATSLRQIITIVIYWWNQTIAIPVSTHLQNSVRYAVGWR